MDVRKMLTPEDQKHYDNVVFPVEKWAVADLLSSPLATASGISHAVVAKGSQIINFCSEDYYLRSNESIIHEVGTILGEMQYNFSLVTGRFKSNRFKIDFIIKDMAIDLGTTKVGDPISAAIQVFNSYDGSQGFSMSILLYRLACSNGMVSPESFLTVKKIHTGQLLDYLDISAEKIREGLAFTRNALEQSTQHYLDMMDFKVREHQLDDFIKEVAEETKFPPSLLPGVQERILVEVKSGHDLNNWLVYNGFNYAINHLNSSLIGRKGRDLDQKVLSYLLD